MSDSSRIYAAIDLKSFYASVECVERGLDPLTANLVVADLSRTEKTICLAVSPALKAYGIPGRARLFEVNQRLRQINAGRPLSKRVEYIIAPPRMALYISYSARIYEIYLKYVAPEDIHVYSIDEVFIDLTAYLKSSRKTAHELTMDIIRDLLSQTGITATAGIGTNLYLCKIAMDIVAKHMPADRDGVRIAELDEMSYRRQLWNHQPLTDFWRVGKGTARRLESIGVRTMGQLARMSRHNEAALYKLFGVGAELLIDHAWGWEPCTMAHIKAYRPESNSTSSGQVLSEPYTFRKARVVAREMADAVALDLVDRGLVTDQIVLTIGYDAESLNDPSIRARYRGELTEDWYGRMVPKHAHGTYSMPRFTSSSRVITAAVSSLFDSNVNPDLLVRRLNVSANHLIPRELSGCTGKAVQLDLFAEKDETLDKEHALQEVLLGIKKKYGKNSILKGLNFEEGATAINRNKQIGGHKA